MLKRTANQTVNNKRYIFIVNSQLLYHLRPGYVVKLSYHSTIILLEHNQGEFNMANKYTYTKEKRDPQIQWHPTKQGKRWRVKFAFVVRDKTVHIEKQGFKSFDEVRAFKAKAYDNEMENRVTVHKRYTVDDYWRIYADNKVKSGAWRSSTAYAREQGYKAYLKDYGEKCF